MPLPQVSDRIKEIPGQALRAVFAGVGQLLLAADKVRAQLAGPEDESGQPGATPASPAAAPPPAVAPRAAAAPAAQPAADPGDSRWRSLDKTGNVRLLPDGNEDRATAASTPPAAAEPEPAEPVPAEPAATAPAEVADVADVAEPKAGLAVPTPAEPAVPPPAEVAEPTPAEPVLGEPAAAAEAALPVVGYDQLTVASLRARLRVLDVAQVQTLLDYEKAHQGRTDVVTMFERRITKLEQGG